MIARDENRILQLGLDTTWQQRLFLVSLMGLRQLEEFDHKTDITVPVTTVTELSGTGVNAYRQARESATGLAGMYIKSRRAGDLEVTTSVQALDRCHYQDEQGSVELRYSKAAIPCLRMLLCQYKQWQLAELLSFRSVYSLRLYSMLKGRRGAVEFRQHEYREQIATNQASYEKLSNLIAKVTRPAIEEINKHTNLTVEFNLLRRKRGWSLLRFTPIRAQHVASPVAVVCYGRAVYTD